MKPLMIDLYAGLGGWAEGGLAEGFYVIGFDIERHEYGAHRYPGQLVIQDLLTLHGSQFRDAALIVASPPCQAYSYRAMPWKRAKALPPPDNTLFDICFRIQREACEAAGRHIPLIVENVRGAQKWVGRAQWNYGSYYLWGDVPALMPIGGAHKVSGLNWSDRTKHGQDFTRHAGRQAMRRTDVGNGVRFTSRDCGIEREGIKRPGIELGEVGFNVANARAFAHMVAGVKIERTSEDKRQHIGMSRKFASAMIAKIPLPLARHIAATFRPRA
jgi:hypothetical protein